MWLFSPHKVSMYLSSSAFFSRYARPGFISFTLPDVTLTGWIGSAKQIEGAQETAKNLISESLTIFESSQDTVKAAEAQTELALCYWREGAFDEARVVLGEAVSRLSDADSDIKAVALLRRAIVERTAKRFNDAFHILSEAASLFEAKGNDSLKGRFHNQFATVLENLGRTENHKDYIDRALIEYTAASYHFEQAGHTRYQACVETISGSGKKNIGLH